MKLKNIPLLLISAVLLLCASCDKNENSILLIIDPTEALVVNHTGGTILMNAETETELTLFINPKARIDLSQIAISTLSYIVSSNDPSFNLIWHLHIESLTEVNHSENLWIAKIVIVDYDGNRFKPDIQYYYEMGFGNSYFYYQDKYKSNEFKIDFVQTVDQSKE